MSLKLVIEVLASAAQAKKEFGELDKSSASVGDKLSKLRGPATAALAGIGAGAFGAVNAASDLNETMSKSEQIFGKQAGAMDAWASGAAKNLGLSKASALDAASSFGDMFSQIGFSGKAAADMSKTVVGLSADLGSFNNLDTADVNERISAAFRGEYDSLQALIPNINAARVETEAMAATGKKSAKDLTAQEKAAAVLAIVQKDGARAAGDFARTQDGAANKTKIAKAQAADLAASLGQRLLPAYAGALQMASSFLDFLGKNQGAVAGVVAGVAALSAVLLAASAASTIYNGAMAVARVASIAYTAAQWLLNAAMTANPIGIIVVAIGLLIAGLVLAWRNSETFRNVVIGAFNAVAAAGRAVWEWIKSAAVAVWSFLTAYVQVQIQIIVTVMNALKGAALAVWNGIKTAASAVWGFITGLVQRQIGIARAVITAFRIGVVAVWNAIKTAASTVWNAVKSVIATVVTYATGRVNALKGVVLAVWTAIQAGATRVWNGIKSSISAVISAIASKFGSLKSTASDVVGRIKSLFSASTLINAGRQLISGLASGIREKIDSAVDAVRRGVQRIKDLLPGSPIKDGPLKSWNNGGAGKRLMGLLAQGIRAEASSVQRELGTVLDAIATPSVRPSVSLGSVSGGVDLSSGQAAPTYVDVTVQAGVGDPVQIGKELSRVLDAYAAAGGRRRATA